MYGLILMGVLVKPKSGFKMSIMFMDVFCC
jgi:hypothetical protein